MNINQKYWTAYRNSKTQYVQIHQATWKNDNTDRKREREGRIFKNKADAVRWADADIIETTVERTDEPA